jgi:hypothetical protein
LSHPVRIRILTALNSPRRVISPNGFAEETGLRLNSIAYHFRELSALGCIEVVDTKRRRGAVEHFYAPVTRAAAWEREWSSLAPIVKQNLAAAGLRMAVEAIGASVDGGKFEARNDSVLAHHTFRTDERGAVETMAILTKALKDLVAISESAEARLAKGGEKGLQVSYQAAGFEGAIRPA